MDLGVILQDSEKRGMLALASKCCIEANRYNWYDSKFLRQFHAAKRFLSLVAPERLGEFIAAFDVLRTDSTFDVKHVDSVFDGATFQRVIDTVHALRYVELEHYESESFGRSLLRHQPFFTELQSALSAMVSEAVGEQVSPAYNFLSLYRGLGRCEPHLDQPSCKWTLDVCLEQSIEWPIYFSQVVDWPAEPPANGPTIEELHADASLHFQSAVLRPNQGVIFSGSSQWHFRRPISGLGGDYCHLLFLHYVPVGAEALANPDQWASHFSIPELGILKSADELVIRKAHRPKPIVSA